jgi:membrane protein insertase Oxa1/YidC/SpoIIIJ
MPSLLFLSNNIVVRREGRRETMELETILKIVFLGLIHWALVPVALNSLVERKRVFLGLKGLWVLPIIFVTCLGPLSYLISHALIPEPRTQPDYWR